jgi:peptidyl-prolyl cis-trans isomerase D
MLHFIRERAQGWIAWFIVALISIPFALWGINSYLGGVSETVVATVNEQPITETEYKRSLQQYRDRMRNMMGEQFDPSVFDTAEVKQMVLDELIMQKVVEAANVELGQTVSNAQLVQFIQSTPAFQKDGAFDRATYEFALRNAGLISPAYYEAQLRKDLLSQELLQNIQQTSTVSAKQVDGLLKLQEQSRSIAYGVISAQAQLENVTVGESAVKAYYDEHQAQYTAPERVAVDYIELSVDELKQNVEVSEAALKQFYADNEDQFVGPEQRRVSHILIEGDDDAAKAEIESIQSRLQSGESFETLAQTVSQDTGSAEQGGDLGFFEKGLMDEAFDNAVFALQEKGDVSDIVQSEFGFHLIKLTDISAPEIADYNNVKADVEDRYRLQQAQDQFYEQVELLGNLTYENADTLDVAAEELGLQVKSTEAFTSNGGSGIASESKVVKAAFSDELLNNDENSEVIEISKTHVVVLHLKQHIESTLLPYDSVSPAIEESLKFEQASKVASEQGKDIQQQLDQGADPFTAFDAENWTAAQNYTRMSKEISQQITQHAFAMTRPQSGQTVYSGFTASNGNYIVVAVSDVIDGDVTSVEQETKDGIKTQLQRIYGDAESKAFVESLKANAEIEIFSELL